MNSYSLEMNKERPQTKLIVVGSGWVGLYIAQNINTSFYDVTMISPNPTSAYTPLLASAACGLLPFSAAEESLRATGKGCKFVKAAAKSVDFRSQSVLCEAATEQEVSHTVADFRIPYDLLVLCPGCQTNTFGIPGVENHALFMKHVCDARRLRTRLLEQLEKASLPTISEEKAKELLHIAIVGGGPTGIEITAELSDMARGDLTKIYPSVSHLMNITVYDVAPHILLQYERKLYEYATEHMATRGIKIATNNVIEKVEATRLHIKGKDPEEFGVLLWTAGNKAVPFVDELDVKKTEHGLNRILTDSRLNVLDAKSPGQTISNVYALGDAADIEEQSLPTTAEVAVQKAKYLVDMLNDARVHTNRAPKSFTYKKRGIITYIGGHDGIAEGWQADVPGSGYRAWLGWRAGAYTWTRTWRTWAVLVSTAMIRALFGKDVVRL